MTQTTDELLATAREAAKKLAERGNDFATADLVLSFFAGALLAAFTEIDRRLTASEQLPDDWNKKCGDRHRNGEIACLLKPGHHGPHRHFTDTSSHAWS